MGSSTQFLHNLSSFLNTTSSVCIRRRSFKLMLVRCRCGSSRPLATPRCPVEGAHSQDETIEAKLHVQLRLENSSVAPLLFAAWGYAWTVVRSSALNCDGASGQWQSRKRLRPQRAGIPCQSRMPHRPSSLERSSLPACRWSFRCRKACR